MTSQLMWTAPEAPTSDDATLDATTAEGASTDESSETEAAPELFAELADEIDDDAEDLPDDDDEQAEEEEEATENLFDDADDSDDPDTTERENVVPKARLDKALQRAREAREEANVAAHRIVELQTQLETTAAGVEAFQKHYGNFKDSAAQLEWDAAFMSTLEQHRNDPVVSKAIEKILAITKGETPMSETKSSDTASTEGLRVPRQPDPAPEKSAPERDPAVQALLEDNARTKIEGVLSELKPNFRTLVTNLILHNSDDLTQLTKASIQREARDYLRENGFKPEDVLEKAPTPSKKKTPPTASSTRGTAPAARPKAPGKDSTKSGEGDNKDSAPKDVNEWRQQRNARIEAFMAPSE